jgi:protein O-GlcNAc transferase
VIPAAEERFYTERVLRVSGSYLAFSVLYPVPPVEPPPCLRSGRITFGSLAPNYKLTDDVLSAWARILRAAPRSRLLLKNTCMDDPSNQAALLSRFARYGIPPERVGLEGSAEHYEFLKAYGRVDIALDTFPYNGGSTTAEALWQGVPVLAFHGDRWVSRMSCSTLLAAGLSEWAAASLEAYIERAIALANSTDTPAMLAALRSRLRDGLSASQACDTAALCRELEEHYVSRVGLGSAEARKQLVIRRTP